MPGPPSPPWGRTRHPHRLWAAGEGRDARRYRTSFPPVELVTPLWQAAARLWPTGLTGTGYDWTQVDSSPTAGGSRSGEDAYIQVTATTQPRIVFGGDFFASAAGLGPGDAKAVHSAVDQFSRNPDHAGLNLHPVKTAGASRLHTIRATRGVRILLAREGDTFVFLEAGPHDYIYERAQRGQFINARATNYLGFVEPQSPGGVEAPNTSWQVEHRARSIDGPSVVEHWTDTELRDIAGFDDELIIDLRRARNPDQVLELTLDNDTWERVFRVLEETPEQWLRPALIVDTGATDEEERLRAAITDTGAEWGLSRLYTPEEVADLLAAPIEDWMVFLHPAQRFVVDRNFTGPARVKGGPGTGKTVVALHRAARLAQTLTGESNPGCLPILFTTYIKSLPPVFEHLYGRLPGTGSSPVGVEFIHIDSLAYRLYREAGGDRRPEMKEADKAFESAHRRVVTPMSPIAAGHITADYLRDEIRTVIKGRGLQHVDEYLAIERTGRRTPLREPQRRQVWALREEYDADLARRGVVDFADIINTALAHVRTLPAPRYRAAIVEEAQDLTLAGLRLVRALVNGPSRDDPADGLLLVGDAAQRIYPGGFRLAHAGINVSGRRSIELTTHYRSTRQILDAAYAVAGDDVVEDMDESFRRGDAHVTIRRDGPVPTLSRYSSKGDEISGVVESIHEMVAGGRLRPGDVGILVTTNREADDYRRALTENGLDSIELSRYRGEDTNAVKVGTWFRAKGLEFKAVYLPGLSGTRWPRRRAQGQSDVEYAEACSLELSRLFVAMTRARDRLAVSCAGEPSARIAEAADRGAFEIMDV